MISGFVVVALALASAESVATIVVPTGLDDDDVKRLHARVDAQVAAAGGKPRALSNALEVKDECLDDPACARAVLRAADAPWLLWVDALRAGPKVQIDARLLDAEGRVVREGGGVVDIADVLKGKTAIPADVLEPLKAAPVGDGNRLPPPVLGRDRREKATTPPIDSAPPPLAIAGVAVASGGALITVVSLVLIPGQFGVLDDPSSLGSEKESASVAVPTLAVFAVGGVLVAAVGGALMFLAVNE